MKYCPSCGSELVENANFCGVCGTVIPNENEGLKKSLKISHIIGLVLLSTVFVIGGIIGGKIYKKVKYDNLISQSEVNIIDKNYLEAESNCQEAIELFPDKPESYICLAKVCEKTYRKEDALDNYEKALSFDAEAVDAYKGILNMYIDNNYVGSMILEIVEEAINHVSNDDLASFVEIQQLLNQLCCIESYQNYMDDNDIQGGISIDGQYVDGTLGVSFAKLLDMNGDRVEELIIAYTESQYDLENIPASIDDYVVEVCTYENRQLKKVYTGTPLVTSLNAKEIVLLQTDDAWKLVKDEQQITSEAQVYVLQGQMELGSKLAFNEMEETKAILDYKNHAIRASVQRRLLEKENNDNVTVPIGNYANVNQGMYLVSKIDEDDSSIIELYLCKREDPFSHHDQYSFKYNSETKSYEYTTITDNPPKIEVYLDGEVVNVNFDGYNDYEITANLFVDDQYDF